MSKASIAYRNKWPYLVRYPDAVFNYDGSGYIDYTEQARNPIAGPVIATGTTTSYVLYLGFEKKVNHLRFVVSQIAAGGTREPRYSLSDGSFDPFITDPVALRAQNFSFINTLGGNLADFVWNEDYVQNWAKTTINKKYMYWLGWFVTSVAGGANSPVFTEISARTIITSSEELVLPTIHLGTNSPSDIWKTPHETIDTVQGKNDMLDYNDGSDDTLTLDPGVRRPAQHASHILDKLGAGYSASFDPIDGFTFGKDSGTFQILCATGNGVGGGVATARSGWGQMGFDCSTDKTGALEYTSDYLRNSAGGLFNIVSANQNLKWTDGLGAHDIGILQGEHSIGSLQAAVKRDMDAETGDDDADLAYDQETSTFSIKRGTDNIALDDSTFLDVIGMVAATDAPIHFGVTRIHTEEWIVLVSHTQDSLPQTPNITTVFGINHNLTDDATAVITSLQITGLFDDPHSMTISVDRTNTPKAKLFYDAADINDELNKNINKITIIDRENPDGYIQLGLIAGFDFGDGYFEFSEQFDYSVSRYKIPFEDNSQSDTGQKTTTLNTVQDGMTVNVPEIVHADRIALEALEDAVGTGTPFLFIPDRDSVNVIEQFMWGTFETLPSVNMVEIFADDLNQATWTTSFAIEEFI